MGALKIDCYCNEQQMSDILSYADRYLTNTDHISLEDIDREFDDIRVCINFEVFMDVVKVKSAEVLDADWDLLYEDTAVLNSRLRHMIQQYNREHTELVNQSAQIQKEYSFC